MIPLVGWVKDNWLLVLLLGLVAGAFVGLRSQPSPVASLDELNGALSAGKPTVMAFYSNF